jgi:predicted PurR-regulated permease PerM
MDKDRGPFLPNPFVAQATRWGLLAWSVIGLLILLAVLFRFVIYPVRVVFPPLVVALIVVYLLNPLVTRLKDRGVPRIIATLLCYVVFLGVVALALTYLIPAVSGQVRTFIDRVPDLLAKAATSIADAASRFGVHLDSKTLFTSLEPKGGAFSYLGRLTSFTSGVVHVAFVLILGPLIAFYLLIDLPKIRRGAEALVPARRRAEVVSVASLVGETIGGFFRGQFVVAIIVGAACLLGYWFVGLPFFALIAALTAILALVPILGLVIAAIPALFVALTTSGRTGGVLHVRGGWPLALSVLVVLILVQQLEARVLSPFLLGRTTRLHPVTALLSLLIGGTLLGLWGMLLAVPVVAAIRVLLLHVWDTRSQWPPPRSEQELQPEPVPAPVPEIPAHTDHAPAGGADGATPAERGSSARRASS